MNKQELIFWSFVILILFISIIQWGKYLINNNYIIEPFSNSLDKDIGDPSTNHNVEVPLTSTFSCKNMCGPNNRCSLTGEQCSSDIDCFGCNPGTKQFSNSKRDLDDMEANYINDSKNPATTLYASTGSSLISDIGVNARIIKNSDNSSPQYFKGVNTWKESFDAGMELYDKRYTPETSEFTPKYPTRDTLSGEFITNGPLASNEF
jgi:hypothetical protein